MKFRPESTTSERQLILAMTAAGRPVTLADLATWRKGGLLPPLASQGLGPGKGKSYYWREENIVLNGCAAFDLLSRYGRPDTVIWMLWLSGFCVPLPQLRRAWAHRGKSCRACTVRPGTDCFEPRELSDFLDGFDTAGSTSSLLLNVALTLCGAVAPDQDGESAEIVEILRRALSRVMRSNRAGMGDSRLAEQLWLVIKIIGAALESSNLIPETNDAEMREAQRYLCVAARLLQDCSDAGAHNAANGPDLLWSSWLLERLGPPLFLLILVLLRSGRHDILQRAAQDIEGIGRQSPVLPAQPSYLHA